MKKNKTLIIILAIIVVLGGLSVLGRFTNKSEMILFFGDTCPHCKNVDKYLEDNGIRNKVKFQELEVYQNKANAELLTAIAKKCNLDTTGGVGVPFLYDGSKCIQGDQPIIDFFKNK
jgi:glutaredoxin